VARVDNYALYLTLSPVIQTGLGYGCVGLTVKQPGFFSRFLTSILILVCPASGHHYGSAT